MPLSPYGFRYSNTGTNVSNNDVLRLMQGLLTETDMRDPQWHSAMYGVGNAMLNRVLSQDGQWVTPGADVNVQNVLTKPLAFTGITGLNVGRPQDRLSRQRNLARVNEQISRLMAGQPVDAATLAAAKAAQGLLDGSVGDNTNGATSYTNPSRRAHANLGSAFQRAGMRNVVATIGTGDFKHRFHHADDNAVAARQRSPAVMAQIHRLQMDGMPQEEIDRIVPPLPQPAARREDRRPVRTADPAWAQDLPGVRGVRSYSVAGRQPGARVRYAPTPPARPAAAIAAATAPAPPIKAMPTPVLPNEEAELQHGLERRAAQLRAGLGVPNPEDTIAPPAATAVTPQPATNFPAVPMGTPPPMGGPDLAAALSNNPVNQAPGQTPQGAPLPTLGITPPVRGSMFPAGLLSRATPQTPPTEMVGPDLAAATPNGQITPGNINLNTRPVVKNADGSFSTVRTMSYTRPDGSVVNIPTVSDEGKVMSNQEAIRYWNDKQQNLGTYTSVQAAENAAQRLHEDQAQQYGPQADVDRILAGPAAAAYAGSKTMQTLGGVPSLDARTAVAPADAEVDRILAGPAAGAYSSSKTMQQVAQAGAATGLKGVGSTVATPPPDPRVTNAVAALPTAERNLVRTSRSATTPFAPVGAPPGQAIPPGSWQPTNPPPAAAPATQAKFTPPAENLMSKAPIGGMLRAPVPTNALLTPPAVAFPAVPTPAVPAVENAPPTAPATAPVAGAQPAAAPPVPSLGVPAVENAPPTPPTPTTPSPADLPMAGAEPTAGHIDLAQLAAARAPEQPSTAALRQGNTPAAAAARQAADADAAARARAAAPGTDFQASPETQAVPQVAPGTPGVTAPDTAASRRARAEAADNVPNVQPPAATTPAPAPAAPAPAAPAAAQPNFVPPATAPVTPAPGPGPAAPPASAVPPIGAPPTPGAAALSPFMSKDLQGQIQAALGGVQPTPGDFSPTTTLANPQLSDLGAGPTPNLTRGLDLMKATPTPVVPAAPQEATAVTPPPTTAPGTPLEQAPEMTPPESTANAAPAAPGQVVVDQNNNVVAGNKPETGWGTVARKAAGGLVMGGPLGMAIGAGMALPGTGIFGGPRPNPNAAPADLGDVIGGYGAALGHPSFANQLLSRVNEASFGKPPEGMKYGWSPYGGAAFVSPEAHGPNDAIQSAAQGPGILGALGWADKAGSNVPSLVGSIHNAIGGMLSNLGGGISGGGQQPPAPSDPRVASGAGSPEQQAHDAAVQAAQQAAQQAAAQAGLGSALSSSPSQSMGSSLGGGYGYSSPYNTLGGGGGFTPGSLDNNPW